MKKEDKNKLANRGEAMKEKEKPGRKNKKIVRKQKITKVKEKTIKHGFKLEKIN